MCLLFSALVYFPAEIEYSLLKIINGRLLVSLVAATKYVFDAIPEAEIEVVCLYHVYGLHAAQERGALFIGPGTPVYAGMVVGICSRNEDMTVNVCKKKQLTNMRASGSDEALRLVPPRIFSLEQCLEFIDDDELVEVTPTDIRLRKKLLTELERRKYNNRMNK